MKYKVLLLSVFLVALGLSGQEEKRQSKDCRKVKDNEALRNLKSLTLGEVFQGVFKTAGGDDTDSLQWASSHLQMPKASGCSYSAFSVHPYAAGSTWCEGVASEGIGEVVLSYIDGDKNFFYIQPGNQSSKKIFSELARPKEVTIYYLVPDEIAHEQQGALVFRLPELSGKQKVTLKDEVGFQKVIIENYDALKKALKKSRLQKDYVLVALEINSVYLGEKSEYKDITCVRNISNSMEEKYYKQVPK
ncbi:hypothetical protein EHQ53_17710 [Leptospira langatensis]|uniref:NAD glycohydrolase translocation F5/8 type C domain-containing protein n=1 Tax=Leptospira langatensis TaxID=2484983 RepID=A0A5F1ZRE8_9LEPT|nr:hypothetical protein [Leptospira langatensis]TGK05466.1 hypothetical protein EHO57_01950 [Leptospira langatensis]TGL38602.1 hypothetical protein EHQ53_17710 [Leptospira langatensis]